jgi:drug/metabolite transporter (DMT)-like permease
VTRRAWIELMIVAALWGASYMFIKIGLRDLSPEGVVFLRTALAALILIPFAVRRDALRGLRDRIPQIVLIAIVQAAGPFLLIAIGEQEISSSLAGILVSCAPIFTAILALWIDKEERLGRVGVIGIGVGIAGVALIVGVDTAGSAILGALAVILASFGYAIGGFWIKRSMKGVQAIGLVTAIMTTSAVLTLPLALLSAPDSMPDAGPLLAMAALGFGGTGIAFVIFYGLIAQVGPSRASVVAYVAPGFTVFYGALLLDERITVATIAGLVLIVGGSWMAAEGRLPARDRVAA